MEPVARTSDPVTSWAAGEEFHASGKAKDHYRMILVTLGRLFPYTSAELARWCPLDRFQVARRLPEMERKGWVDRTDPIECPVLKRKCVGWMLSEVGAAKVDKLLAEEVL